MNLTHIIICWIMQHWYVSNLYLIMIAQPTSGPDASCSRSERQRLFAHKASSCLPDTPPAPPTEPRTSLAPTPMERYLITGGTSPVQPAELATSLHSSLPNMADGSLIASAAHTADNAALSLAVEDYQYTKMAQAVAALLSPTITAAVDRAVTAGIK